MRIVFVGAGKLTIMTASALLEHGHEVVIVETSREKIEELSGKLDCGFLHGDGSSPGILKETDPEHTDLLICLTGSDQINIIASLVGRSLGFPRVVTKIDDQELDNICNELGLENTIIPTRTISRYLTDMVEGKDILEMFTMFKGDARLFSFVARKEDEGSVSDLNLPVTARVICFYREGKFMLADSDTKLKEKDEVVVITLSQNISDLKNRWTPKINSENKK